MRAYWPRVTVDQMQGERREWIHPEVPQYYLHRFPKEARYGEDAGKWVVIDRDADFADGRAFRRKSDCIRDFVRRHDPENAW